MIGRDRSRPSASTHVRCIGRLAMAAANLVPETLMSQVVAVFDPRRVILIGSRARGTAREDSDYDLVVVLDDEVPDELLSARRRYEGRRGLAVSADTAHSNAVGPIDLRRIFVRCGGPRALVHFYLDRKPDERVAWDPVRKFKPEEQTT